MSKDQVRAERVEAIMDDAWRMEDSCLDSGNVTLDPPSVPKRFAVLEFGGRYRWITFFDFFEDATHYANQAPTGESPWCVESITDLDTGEKWNITGYKAQIEQAVKA